MKKHVWEFNDRVEVFFAKIDAASTVYSKNPPYNPIGEFLSKHNKSYSRFSISYSSLFSRRYIYPFPCFVGKIESMPSGIKITGTRRNTVLSKFLSGSSKDVITLIDRICNK